MRTGRFRAQDVLVSLGLYVASLLLVLGCGILVVRTERALPQVLGLWAVVVLYYAAGLVLFHTVERLRVAAVALTGTGLAVMPFAGWVGWSLLGGQGSVAWLLVSGLGTLMMAVACAVMDSRVLAYLCLGFLVSDSLALASVVGAGLVWHFVMLALLASVLGLLSAWAPRTLPRRLAASADTTFRWIVPAAALGTLVIGPSLRASEVSAAFGAFSLYAIVFLALGRSVVEYAQARAYPVVALAALGVWWGHAYAAWVGIWCLLTLTLIGLRFLPAGRWGGLRLAGPWLRDGQLTPTNAGPGSDVFRLVDVSVTAFAAWVALRAQLQWAAPDLSAANQGWSLDRLLHAAPVGIPWWAVASAALLATPLWAPWRASEATDRRLVVPAAVHGGLVLLTALLATVGHGLGVVALCAVLVAALRRPAPGTAAGPSPNHLSLWLPAASGIVLCLLVVDVAPLPSGLFLAARATGSVAAVAALVAACLGVRRPDRRAWWPVAAPSATVLAVLAVHGVLARFLAAGESSTALRGLPVLLIAVLLAAAAASAASAPPGRRPSPADFFATALIAACVLVVPLALPLRMPVTGGLSAETCRTIVLALVAAASAAALVVRRRGAAPWWLAVTRLAVLPLVLHLVLRAGWGVVPVVWCLVLVLVVQHGVGVVTERARTRSAGTAALVATAVLLGAQFLVTAVGSALVGVGPDAVHATAWWVLLGLALWASSVCGPLRTEWAVPQAFVAAAWCGACAAAPAGAGVLRVLHGSPVLGLCLLLALAVAAGLRVLAESLRSNAAALSQDGGPTRAHGLGAASSPWGTSVDWSPAAGLWCEAGWAWLGAVALLFPDATGWVGAFLLVGAAGLTAWALSGTPGAGAGAAAGTDPARSGTGAHHLVLWSGFVAALRLVDYLLPTRTVSWWFACAAAVLVLLSLPRFRGRGGNPALWLSGAAGLHLTAFLVLWTELLIVPDRAAATTGITALVLSMVFGLAVAIRARVLALGWVWTVGITLSLLWFVQFLGAVVLIAASLALMGGIVWILLRRTDHETDDCRHASAPPSPHDARHGARW